MNRALVVFLPLLLSASAEAYVLQGPSWNTDRGPVEYTLHPDGSDDVTDGSDLDALRRAFELWGCVEGSSLRFEESDETGARTDDQTDGINNVFWDETGSFALGPATASVTRMVAFVPGEPAVRDAFDVIFNGVDYTWVTTPPTEENQFPIHNTMVREIGVMIGLDAECTDPDDPATCAGPDDSVMSPYIPAADRTTLAQDDIDGVHALYATDDGSACGGPFRQGERCACNDDCLSGMICSPDTAGVNRCSPLCTSEDANCPSGFVCLLGAGGTANANAQGKCVRTGADGLVPVAGTCEQDRQCQEGLCALAVAAGRNVCRVSCDVDGDCGDGYRCAEGHCLWAGDGTGTPCDTGEPPGPGECGCNEARGDGAGAGLLLLGLCALVVRVSRRSRRRAAS